MNTINFDHKTYSRCLKDETAARHSWKHQLTSIGVVVLIMILMSFMGPYSVYTFFFISSSIFILFDMLVYRRCGMARAKLYGTKYGHPYLIEMMNIMGKSVYDIGELSEEQTKKLSDKYMVADVIISILTLFAFTSAINFALTLLV